MAEHDAEQDRQQLAELACWCQQFSPLVGWETVNSQNASRRTRTISPAADSLLLDVTGLAPLFGGEEQLCEEVTNGHRQRGLFVFVAPARTAGAAWALAHFDAPRRQEPLTNLTAMAERQRLLQLPVESLRLPDDTAETLRRLGITRVEHLHRLPRASLRTRFGDSLLLRFDQAFGAARETLVAHHAAPEFTAEWPLEHPTDRRDAVERILQQLLARVTKRLAERQRGALRLVCSLRPLRGEAALVQLGLFQPTAQAEHLLDLLKMQLETTLPPGPIAHIEVRISLAAPLQQRQVELFGEEHAGRPALALLIDRLSSRLGPHAVVRARLQADAQPERAIRYLPLTGPKPRPQRRSPPGPAERPLRLHYPPVLLNVLTTTKTAKQANVVEPPRQFRYGAKLYHVQRCWGPERIETGWWRGGSVRRDYYRVETKNGVRFWLFRQLQNNQWFLHGEFW